MTPERWQKVNEVFQEAVELDPDKQKSYLEKACADDDSLLQQVETLLAANDQAGTFIAGNAAEDVAHLITVHDTQIPSGESLGNYEIVSVLGSGGMGRVYLAKDSKLNRSIAVKTLPSSFSGESDYVKRFQTEAKAAANLNHPNVATVYSVEETDENQTLITMEYVEGKPLSESIPTNGFEQRTFLELFVAISDALSHAHEKGIVHRDIKPGNIMVTPKGTPKILDFGLARINKTASNEHSTLSLTKTGQVMGTPAYMSPEQAEGKEADHRSDIFSLGVVMYEAISGEKPFKGDNYASVVSNLLKNEPMNIADIKPEIPYLLSRLIMKCLSKDPRYRYQSMNEVHVLLREVNSAINSGASLSKPDQVTSTKKSSLSPTLLFAGIGLLGLIGIVSLWNWLLPRSNSSNEIVKFTVVGDKTNQLSILSTRISPDGNTLLFTNIQNKNERIQRRSLDSFEVEMVTGTNEAKFAFYSPDGQWIGFATDSDKIQKIPLLGGDPITVCDSCSTIRVGFWGTDGFIYFSSEEGLRRVSSDGGKPELITNIDRDGGEINHYQPFLLPNEKSLLFTVSNGEGLQLAILDLASKKWNLIKEAGEGWFPKYISTGHLIFARDKQLMAMPFDSSNAKPTGKPKLVVSGLFPQAPNIQVSDDGTLTYIPNISRTQNQVVWVNRQGEITPAFDQKGDFVSPRISPDGNRVVVRFNDDIWTFGIKDGSRIRITDDGKSEIPMWSLDGESIFYTSTKDDRFVINKKSADGTGEAEEIHNESYRLIPYSLHPTENLMSLVSRKESSDIFVKSLDDKELKPLITTKFGEDTPRFSPDGKWFSYVSMDTGRPQIYVHPWSDFGKKFPVTTEPGMFPVWSKNSKEIAYRLGSKFYSVAVDSSKGFSVLKRKRLFEGQYLTSFDISPDGKRFLLVRDEHGTLPSKLNVVLNWTEELKRIMREPS